MLSHQHTQQQVPTPPPSSTVHHAPLHLDRILESAMLIHQHVQQQVLTSPPLSTVHHIPLLLDRILESAMLSHQHAQQQVLMSPASSTADRVLLFLAWFWSQHCSLISIHHNRLCDHHPHQQQIMSHCWLDSGVSNAFSPCIQGRLCNHHRDQLQIMSFCSWLHSRSTTAQSTCVNGATMTGSEITCWSVAYHIILFSTRFWSHLNLLSCASSNRLRDPNPDQPYIINWFLHS